MAKTNTHVINQCFNCKSEWQNSTSSKYTSKKPKTPGKKSIKLISMIAKMTSRLVDKNYSMTCFHLSLHLFCSFYTKIYFFMQKETIKSSRHHITSLLMLSVLELVRVSLCTRNGLTQYIFINNVRSFSSSSPCKSNPFLICFKSHQLFSRWQKWFFKMLKNWFSSSLF